MGSKNGVWSNFTEEEERIKEKRPFSKFCFVETVTRISPNGKTFHGP
jgi:hypothetical protein